MRYASNRRQRASVAHSVRFHTFLRMYFYVWTRPVYYVIYCVLSHAFIFYVLFKFTHVKIFTTLTKTFPSGVVSNWEFGRLPNGWFKAQCSNGKERYFPTERRMDTCIRAFQHKYGYQKKSVELVKQLALSI